MKSIKDSLLYIPVIFTVIAVTESDNHNASSKVLYTIQADRIRGFTDRTAKDIVFGGLFSIHNPTSSGRCSSSLDKRGLERVEAFLYAIDKINSDPFLLPNISLGFDIRDTCTVENVALDESVSLMLVEGVFNNDVCEEATNLNQTMPVIAGIIGPTTSPVALPVAGLLRLFTVPQVSYSASSSALNNRDRYGYFFRTIPPDDQQAQAMVDLVLKFGWTFVSVLHSNNEYGEAGSEMFRQLASSMGVCIDLDIGMDEDFQEEDYARVALKLFNEATANVVVFFASRNFIDPFMENFSKIVADSNRTRQFLWIASDSWAQAIDIVNDYPDIVNGSLWGIAPLSEGNLTDFESYFSELSLKTNTRNAWFSEYLTHLGCPMTESILECPHYSFTSFNVQLVIDAVYSLANAVDGFLHENCDQPVKWDPVWQRCQGHKRMMNGTVLREYLQEVNFTSPLGKHITFDAFGNPEANYEITNFQLDNGKYIFVRTGTWFGSAHVGKRLQIVENVTLQFGKTTSDGPLLQLNSSCQLCPAGHIKRVVPSSCCGVCLPCVGQNYTNSSSDAFECGVCPPEMWGNKPLVGSSFCQHIRESYLSLDEWFGMFLAVLAFFGIICVVIVSVAMGVLWKSPMIKSSGREQMIIVLVGVTMCFLLTVFFLLKPSITVCFFQRTGIWFCFSLILSALFVKLLRIARIFLRSQTSKPPRFIQPVYQIIFTMMLLAIQLLLVLVSLLIVHPEPYRDTILNRENTNDHPVLLEQCAAPHQAMIAVQMVYYSILLIASNTLALLTIRFPDNFNEVRYVAATTFSVGLVWLAFLVTYFATEDKYHTAIISFSVQISAVAVLFCFYFPRIFNTIMMKFNQRKDLYSLSSPNTTSSSGSNRLSLQNVLEKLSMQRSTNANEEELTTETFKAANY